MHLSSVNTLRFCLRNDFWQLLHFR